MALLTGVIGKSVGVGGLNLRNDVLLVQRLLNAVPVAQGGPFPALDVDGSCGMKTCGAIRTFQSRQGGYADGRIDPGQKTEQALLALLQQLGVLAQLLGGAGGVPGMPQPGGPANTSALRARIKEWALRGAQGPYGDVGGGAAKGIVSDLDTVIETSPQGLQRTVRRGWKNYKEFFDVAVAGWSENHWKAPGFLEGVKKPGGRIPQPGRSGISWCGIFATWCWIKAGKQTKWVAGVGPTNATRVAGNAGIQVGDICVQMGGEVHHFVAVEPGSATFLGVNGNSDYQSILQKPMSLSTVQYYYRPE